VQGKTINVRCHSGLDPESIQIWAIIKIMKYSSENHNWDLTIRSSSDLVVLGRITEKNRGYSFAAFTGAMLLAVAGLESFLNSMAYFIDDEDFSYDFFENKAIEKKLDFFLKKYNIDLDKGARPYQTFKTAVRWRNSISHSKPTYVEETEIFPGDNIRDLPIQHISKNKYEPYEFFINEKNADKFNRDIIEIIEKIIEVSGIEPRAQCVHKL